jgi:hypothetical protein
MRIILTMTLLGFAIASDATPIYVDFKVKQSEPSGTAAAGVYSGTWSFDDSLAKPGALFEDVFEGRKLDTFSFSWLGQTWSVSSVRLARLEFDARGELRSWIIGARAVSGGCGSVGTLDCVGVPSRVADFYLSATRAERGIPPPELVAVGVRPGSEKFIEARGTFKVRKKAVPAPGAVPLTGAALLCIGIMRRVRLKMPARSVQPQDFLIPQRRIRAAE